MADIVEVIKGLDDIQKHLDTGYSYAICWNSGLIRDAITLLKEQQPKTGHWFKKMSSCPSAIAMGGSKICACDLCGGWGRKTFQYCPHCGAKMEKQP